MSQLGMLTQYLAYPFVRAALVVGVLVALCCSQFGVTLVLNHQSFLGDSLSHVAFAAMAIAGVLKIADNFILTLALTCACSVILTKRDSFGGIQGDSSLAMLSVGALACGYLLMNLFANSANVAGDVCGVLFGSTSILTLTTTDVVASLVLTVGVIAFYLRFHREIFLITFDEEYARATGLPVARLKTCMAVIMSVVIVVSMNLVGALLITALVVFPVRSAMLVNGSYRSVAISAGVISVVSVLVGMLVSIVVGTPVGSTVIAVDAVAYVVIAVLSRVRSAR